MGFGDLLFRASSAELQESSGTNASIIHLLSDDVLKHVCLGINQQTRTTILREREKEREVWNNSELCSHQGTGMQ
jgi:hypothetical protein